MSEVRLTIESPDGSREVLLDRDEVTVGRTEPSDIILSDSGLSRKNTTFFREDATVLVVDENSTNGTFLNGERLSGGPRRVRDGDRISMGNGTAVTVRFTAEAAGVSASTPPPTKTAQPTAPPAAPRKQIPAPVLIGVISAVVIVFFSLLGILAVSLLTAEPAQTSKPTTTIVRSAIIPVRVVDPLGGEDPDDLDDLIASWETAEQELNVSTVGDVSAPTDSDLNVTSAFLAEQKAKAMSPRSKETGIRPAGLVVPKELFGDGVVKQKVKLAQMRSTGYRQPLDFAELAEKRMSGELIEMPMATDSYYLEVGGSAQESPFNAFSFQEGQVPIVPGTPKWDILSRLAANFSGQQYSLESANDRKQMRMRLLRMFNQRAKPILKEIADAYYRQFNRPLRVTSLTRSMDYQILLNATNANSFKVRGEGSLPPHTSGCAFDLARKHMDVDEQNFLMQKLAEMERAGKIDALIEYGVNACFHIFIYHDGAAPAM
jgi:hypothetical protein